MNSVNNDRMQSSSCGDDEYNSLADSSISAFFNTTNPQPPDPHHHQQTHSLPPPPPSISDALSNLFDPSPTQPFLTDQSQSRVGPKMVRNPKKRTRASKRAPTTVLKTDTTNFRAMVQEFTGIPAPPLITSSFFPRTTRLDLFGTSSSSLPPHPPPPPSYLLRPLAQKLQPVLNVQSHLNQAPVKYNPILNSAILGTKQQEYALQINPSNDEYSHLKMGVLEEFGTHHRHQVLLSYINGNYSGSGSSGDKGSDQNMVTRTSKGMVESWICSSD